MYSATVIGPFSRMAAFNCFKSLVSEDFSAAADVVNNLAVSPNTQNTKVLLSFF